MKRIILVLIFLFYYIFSAIAYDKNVDFRLGKSNNNFAINFYLQLIKTEKENIVFSPISIFIAMAMVAEGSAGLTWREISSVLNLIENENKRWYLTLNYINSLKSNKKNFNFLMANNIWIQKNFICRPEYLSIISKYYISNVDYLDFIKSPDKAAKRINKYIEEKTNKKIKNLISRETIGKNVRLILTNVVYFNAKWENKFKAQNTDEQDFFMNKQEKTKVKMMHQKVYGKIENFLNKAKVLELPYEGREVSFFVFLPDIDRMSEFEEVLTTQNINKWLNKRKQGDVKYNIELSLPKFKIEIDCDLKEILNNMGVNLAFIPNIADFSKITGKKELFISRAIHKTFIVVDEEGTEAAAATTINISLTMMPEKAKDFTVDHPFVFLIIDNLTKTILFMGKVLEPKIN